MKRLPFTLVVTTLNNAATLEACLASAAFADEILLLDSGSSDQSVAIAQGFGARIVVEAFKGYGPQKQSAIDQAAHDWILLLDADEALSNELAEEIQRALIAPQASGFSLPRTEQMFWRWQHPWSKHNHHLRLFDRRVHRIQGDPVHAAPGGPGRVVRLKARFRHQGEPNLHTKVEKINHYSTGLVAHRSARGAGWLRTRMVFYPPLVFVKHYILKRQFLSGWAGFIASVSGAYYAFLKYAKLFEAKQGRRDG
ncbi:MAG: glycosyltransferase family 2 protein [Porticoccaceae bacterium]